MIFIIIFFLALTRLGCIDFCGGGGASSSLSAQLSAFFFSRPIGDLALLLLLLLLLVLSFLSLSLKFIYSRVFYGVAVSASLSGTMSAIAQTSLVHVFDV